MFFWLCVSMPEMILEGLSLNMWPLGWRRSSRYSDLGLRFCLVLQFLIPDLMFMPGRGFGDTRLHPHAVSGVWLMTTTMSLPLCIIIWVVFLPAWCRLWFSLMNTSSAFMEVLCTSMHEAEKHTERVEASKPNMWRFWALYVFSLKLKGSPSILEY